MTPSQLIDGFLHALTGDQKDPGFSVAQDYLTDGARKNWTTPGLTKIVNSYTQTDSSQPPVDHISYPGSAPTSSAPPVGTEDKITVSGFQVAQLDALGFLSYPPSQTIQQEFTVKYLGPATGWRIATAPMFRMIDKDAFKRVYQTYQSALPVYLPTPHDQAQQMDQVYLTQATGRAEYTYDALAQAVLRGRYPRQNSQLALAKPVTVSPTGAATVTLQVPPDGRRDITDAARALGLTFRDASETQQLLSASPLTSVQVTYAGCTGGFCRSQPPISYTAQVPLVYWVCPQGQNGSQSVLVSAPLPTPSGQATPCPGNGKAQSAIDLSGVQLSKDTPVAVKQAAGSADVRSPSGPLVAAVVDSAGRVMVVSAKNPSDRRPWYTAASAAQVTDLEWDPVDGSLWVVDNGNLYRVQDPDGNRSSVDSQKVVLVPGGQVNKFKPSPDGSRAVVLTGGAVGAAGLSPVAMVIIDRTGGVPSISPATAFGLLGDTWLGDYLQTATDAAWADGRTVVVLGVPENSNTAKLFKVYLDGTQDSAISNPEDVQPAAKHIAAATGDSPSGHASLWLLSDGSGATDSGGTGAYVYFKKSGSTDSSQELGSTPVVATTATG
jgi:hypothetical protein